MSATGIGDSLGRAIDWLWGEGPIASSALTRARALWVDTLGCAIAGSRAPQVARWAALQAQTAPGRARIPGDAHALSAPAAAGVWAAAACWDEACEGLALAHGRPGVPVVAALAALVPYREPTWGAVLRATVAGYEVGARAGASLRIRPGMHVDGVWPALGVAAAVAHLHEADAPAARAALEACATQIPFTLYWPIPLGGTIRNTYLAHSAALGMAAVQAVQAGLGAPSGAIDAFARIALDPDATRQAPEPGEWLLLQSYWKRHACVRHVQYGIEAAAQLRAAIADTASIDAVRLDIYPEAVRYCGNRAPATPLAAQFSLSFGVAAMLRFGEVGPEAMRDGRFDDAELRRIEALVETVAEPARFPDSARGARVTVRMGSSRHEASVDGIVGDPGRFPGRAALLEKFDRYAAPLRGAHAIAEAMLDAPDDTPASVVLDAARD